jgi:hypothetical protein
MLRLSAGPGIPDTLVTHEPVANGEYSDAVGEFKAPGINNLSEEDMDTPTHTHTKLKKYCSRKPWTTKTANDGPRKKLKGVRYLRTNAQKKKGPTHPRTMKES